MESEKTCGCKGVRTCLMCEKEDKTSKSSEENKITDQYEYCFYCDFCWPVNSTESSSPLYLGKLTVIPDFITMDEEAEIILGIDQIEWMPSQSGRKKQDFGPKVNFKKKKGKVGNFKGFPLFTENLIERLKQTEKLTDFRPVELCHLDYEPDRGSAIEPHLDDHWIWGDRLVTINLNSPTILTFSPAKHLETCDCATQALNSLYPNFKSPASKEDSRDCNGKEAVKCNTQMTSDKCIDSNHVKSFACPKTHACNGNSIQENKGKISVDLPLDEQIGSENLLDSKQAKCIECPMTSNEDSLQDNKHYISTDCLVDEVSGLSLNSIKNCNHQAVLEKLKNSINTKEPNTILDMCTACNHQNVLGKLKDSVNPKEPNTILDMCTAYRTRPENKCVEVLVPLPPRSLVVVAGCSRYHWFHEIKRKDVVSRRLAMTFRELASNFMEGGPDEALGKKLLELGETFY